MTLGDVLGIFKGFSSRSLLRSLKGVKLKAGAFVGSPFRPKTIEKTIENSPDDQCWREIMLSASRNVSKCHATPTKIY